jgi:hypothetical protein
MGDIGLTAREAPPETVVSQTGETVRNRWKKKNLRTPLMGLERAATA